MHRVAAVAGTGDGERLASEGSAGALGHQGLERLQRGAEKERTIRVRPERLDDTAVTIDRRRRDLVSGFDEPGPLDGDVHRQPGEPVPSSSPGSASPSR